MADQSFSTHSLSRIAVAECARRLSSKVPAVRQIQGRDGGAFWRPTLSPWRPTRLQPKTALCKAPEMPREFGPRRRRLCLVRISGLSGARPSRQRVRLWYRVPCQQGILQGNPGEFAPPARTCSLKTPRIPSVRDQIPCCGEQGKFQAKQGRASRPLIPLRWLESVAISRRAPCKWWISTLENGPPFVITNV